MSNVSLSRSHRKICLVIGDPIAHSLSPLMHNYAYSRLGLSEQFIFTAAHVAAEQLPQAIAGLRALGIRGCSVTLPYKQAVIPMLDQVDPLAEKIGAVNTILNQDGILCGFNTDYYGFLLPLKRRTSLLDAKTLVLGAGGAARSAVMALKDAGAKVTIVNRTYEKAESLAREFGVAVAEWNDERIVTESAVVVNCTSAELLSGSAGLDYVSKRIKPGQFIFDSVYTKGSTEFIRQAKAAGAHVIDGLELLAGQGAEQFRLYTGKEVGFDIMFEALKLGGN
jgi:shikimate dehydrogenase